MTLNQSSAVSHIRCPVSVWLLSSCVRMVKFWDVVEQWLSLGLACMVFGKADIGQYEAEDRTKSYET